MRTLEYKTLQPGVKFCEKPLILKIDESVLNQRNSRFELLQIYYGVLRRIGTTKYRARDQRNYLDEKYPQYKHLRDIALARLNAKGVNTIIE